MSEFSRSKSLPLPQDYWTLKKNPILCCIIDQTRQDLKLGTRHQDQALLLNDIIEGLETKRIDWPNEFSLMLSENWIQKMKDNPKFYYYHAKNYLEMKEYEDLLLNLIAQCLKRQIKLIPFLEQDTASTFKPNNYIVQSDNLQFHLLSCQRLDVRNFFFSIFQNV